MNNPTPESVALQKAKDKTTERRDLLNEIDRLESVLSSELTKYQDLKLVTKEVKTILEKLIEGEGDRKERDHYFSTDMARAVAMITECLGRARGGA